MLQVDRSTKCLNKQFKDWFVLHGNRKSETDVDRISLLTTIERNATLTIHNTRKIGQNMRIRWNRHVTSIFTHGVWALCLPCGKQRTLFVVPAPSRLLKTGDVQRGLCWLKQSKLPHLTRQVASKKNRGENGESLSAISSYDELIVAYGNAVASLKRTISNRFRKP